MPKKCGDGNVYDKFKAAAGLYMLSMELKWHTNEQVQWPGGGGEM